MKAKSDYRHIRHIIVLLLKLKLFFSSFTVTLLKYSSVFQSCTASWTVSKNNEIKIIKQGWVIMF